jgi:hypothetical protein
MFSPRVKKGAGIFAALMAMGMIVAMSVSTIEHRVLPLTVTMAGVTNVNGKPHLAVRFSKAIDQPWRATFGHEAWWQTSVELSFTLADGTITNEIWEWEGGRWGGGPRRAILKNGPETDHIYTFPIPASTKMIRINKAISQIGSFQDTPVPIDLPSNGRVFNYRPPEVAFAIPYSEAQ